jgi:hypothetical protein
MGKKEDRVDTFLHEVESAIEIIADGYSDLGIYLEKDFRGAAATLAVRVREDKSGGIIKRNEFEPIIKKTRKK